MLRYDLMGLSLHPFRGGMMPHPIRALVSCGLQLPASRCRVCACCGETVCPADLWDQPLIISHQRSDDRRLAQWMQRDLSQLHIVATYNLVFNASLLVDEGLGYALCFDKLINTRGSSLCFRPFVPRLESTAYIIWKKYQVFSKAASAFLTCLKQLTEQ